MRLCVCVPSYGDWAADFGHSLALLMADLARQDEIASVRLSRCESTIVAEGRTDLVKDALRHEATHLLFLDADMRFRWPHIRSLIARDLDVVACTYPKRRPPHEMTAQAMDGSRITPGDGVVEAAHVGFGVALIKASVFGTLPEPWFAHPWLEADKRFVSEDIWFCRHARAHGVRTYVDREASVGIGHVGKQVFEAERLQ
jgi:hypothetical protein